MVAGSGTSLMPRPLDDAKGYMTISLFTTTQVSVIADTHAEAW